MGYTSFARCASIVCCQILVVQTRTKPAAAAPCMLAASFALVRDACCAMGEP